MRSLHLPPVDFMDFVNTEDEITPSIRNTVAKVRDNAHKTVNKQRALGKYLAEEVSV